MFATPGTVYPEAHAILMPTGCTIPGVDSYNVVRDGKLVGNILMGSGHIQAVGGLHDPMQLPDASLAEGVDAAVQMYLAEPPWWH